MKRKPKFLFLLPVVGLFIFTSSSQAQLTATARIILTIIPPPIFKSIPENSRETFSSANQANEGEITFHTSRNIAIVLNSFDHKKMPATTQFGQDEIRILTAKDLDGVSSVEVIYLGY